MLNNNLSELREPVKQSNIPANMQISLAEAIKILKCIPEPPALLSCCANITDTTDQQIRPISRARPTHNQKPLSDHTNTSVTYNEPVGFQQIRPCENSRNKKPDTSSHKLSAKHNLSIGYLIPTLQNPEQKINPAKINSTYTTRSLSEKEDKHTTFENDTNNSFSDHSLMKL